MRNIAKLAAAATFAGILAVSAATPSQAANGRNTAAAIGFGAGALVGAAVASSAAPYYYGPDYAYAPDYAYYGDYAYDPDPGYYGYAYVPGPRARSRAFYRDGPGCIQSPASREYTSCN